MKTIGLLLLLVMFGGLLSGCIPESSDNTSMADPSRAGQPVWSSQDGSSGMSESSTGQGGDEKRYRMETEQESYPLGTETIKVAITYIAEEGEGSYGFGYGIERQLEDGEWEGVPIDFSVIALAAILQPGETGELTVDLYPEQYAYTPGRYRVVKTDTNPAYYAEFTLE